jgi:hypothetical protein
MPQHLSRKVCIGRLTAVACELQGLHGTFLAAAFLADVGVPIDMALAMLSRPQTLGGQARSIIGINLSKL